MLNMLEWVKKQSEDPAGARSDATPRTGSLPDLQGADPVTALEELRGWLEPTGPAAGADPKARSEVHARIQESGAAHVAALLALYLTSPEGKLAAREAAWKSLVHYQSRLTQALAASAEILLSSAKQDHSLLLPGAASAARALQACRTFAKVGLIHYSRAPGSLWRLAYSLHARAEGAGCAELQVRAHSDQRTVTTVSQELLRLLMLQMSSPDMLAPEQIEVVDRVVEQVGGDFTLRPPGVADNPFYFEPGGDALPRRVPEPQAQTGPGARYFGPGMGFDALERLRKQLASARLQDVKAFGKDISPATQLSAVEHLLMFWRNPCPYSPPPHTRIAGSLQASHRYAQIWKQLSGAKHSPGELALADADDGAPQVPETWTLHDAGGNELGAELAQSGGGWAKCGEVVGLSVHGGSERWVGIIRRMHAEPGGSLHADIAVLSRNPQAVSLREVLEKGEDTVFSEASSRQFAFNAVRAIILSDGADGSQPPNFLLSPECWKEGQIYEMQAGEAIRYVRGLQVVRRGGDYVRATFEWASAPG